MAEWQGFLNDVQVAVLGWVRDGCPAGVYEGYSYRSSTAALVRRGLITQSGRGQNWLAHITAAGERYLDDPPEPREPESRKEQAPTKEPPASEPSSDRSAGRAPKTEELVAQLVAAGGELRLPARFSDGAGARQRAYAAQTAGRLPEGKRLTTSLDGEFVVVRLLDRLADYEPAHTAVAVPEKVSHYHQVARRFRERTARHQVSRALLPRVVRLVHAVCLEAETRGWSVETFSPIPELRHEHDRRRSTPDGQIAITVGDHIYRLRFYEKGVRLRGPVDELREQRRNPPRWSSYYPSDPVPRYDADAEGTLLIDFMSGDSTYQWHTWRETKTISIEDRLPQVFATLEARALRDDQAVEQQRLEAEEKERSWQVAMGQAKQRYQRGRRIAQLDNELRRRAEADRIRHYRDALLAERGDDTGSQEWIEWIGRYADEMDPVTAGKSLTAPDDTDEIPLAELDRLLPRGMSAYGAQWGGR